MDLDEEEYMSTKTVQQLQLHCPTAMASLQVAMREVLVPATAAQLQEQEYYYDSDDSVLHINEQCLKLAEWVVQWQAT